MIDLRKKDDMIAAIEEILQQEALKGNQHKIDKNKNNKIDAEDFKILRKEETVDEGLKDVAKKAFKALTGGSDEDQLKNLQKKMGVPQTGKKPEPQKEEVEQIEEDTMTHITLGKKVKNDDGGHDQEVHYKGKKIGHIESYKHRTGLRYGGVHHATGDMEAGSRSPEEAINFIRSSHAEHLKSMKEEVEQIDELSKSTLGSYVKGAARDAGASHKLGADFKNQADKSRTPGSKAASSRLSDKFYNMAQKRHTGIGKAVERLTKEEENMPKTLKQFKENAFDWKKKPEPTPNGGSGVKQGSRYGGSKQKDTPEQDTDEKK
jgi:hypothetical protein